VTLAIKQLEQYLGVSLLERTTRSVSLTKEGQNFIPIVNKLVLDFDLAMTDMTGIAECRFGHVSIAVVASIATNIMPPTISTFTKKHPDISMHLFDDNSQGVQQRVEANEVDFGISSVWQPNKKLNFIPFLQDTFEVVCHKDHDLATKNTQVSWNQLEGLSFMGSGLTNNLKMQKYIGNPKFQISNTTTLIAMLKANIGITVLPSMAVPKDPEIRSFPLEKPYETRNICIITRRNTSLSPAAKAMISTLSEHTPQLVQDTGLNANILYTDLLKQL
jgi:DNA-binding transcriptional LysR family regulator